MWLAVETDKETCEQCQFYDGQRWTHDWKPVAGGSEFPGKPPLHKGCRCALVEVDLDAKTPKWFKLDDVLKKENRNVLESVHGKAATDAYFKGDIDAKQLLRQGVKLSPDEFSELRSAYEKELRRGEK